MKQETKDYIEELYKKGLINPSGIVSLIYLTDLESTRYGELRKYVIKELDRIDKKMSK